MFLVNDWVANLVIPVCYEIKILGRIVLRQHSARRLAPEIMELDVPSLVSTDETVGWESEMFHLRPSYSAVLLWRLRGSAARVKKLIPQWPYKKKKKEAIIASNGVDGIVSWPPRPDLNMVGAGLNSGSNSDLIALAQRRLWLEVEGDGLGDRECLSTSSQEASRVMD